MFLIVGVCTTARAQDPAQLTDLRYGNLERSQADGIHAANGQLYLTHGFVSHQDGAGFISRIDSRTGRLAAVLKPEAGARFRQPNAGTSPSLYHVGGKTFAVVATPATGGALYRLEGDDAVLLHTAPSSNYSALANLNGKFYFLTDHAEKGTREFGGGAYGHTLLFETDGALVGTRLLAELPYQGEADYLEVIAGQSSLLLVSGKRNALSYHVHSPATGATVAVKDGATTLVTSSPAHLAGIQTLPTATYHAGAFYLFAERAVDATPQLLRVDAATGNTSHLAISGIRPAGTGQLIVHEEELLLYATTARGITVSGLFRIEENANGEMAAALLPGPSALRGRVVTAPAISFETELVILTNDGPNFKLSYYQNGEISELNISSDAGIPQRATLTGSNAIRTHQEGSPWRSNLC